MKVLIIDKIHSSLQRTLEEEGHECLDMSEAPENEVRMALPFAEILVLRSGMNISSKEIDGAPNLKIISRPGAGVEHIDVDYARQKGIEVITSPEGNRQAVAEHALGMLLALFNKLSKANTEVRSATWLRKENEGEELSGKTVGIIGFGNTGSAFAKVLTGFDVKILAYDAYKSGHDFEASMNQIFEAADVVSLHLPMTAETRNLVNSNWLGKYRKPIYLINTSRGAIVNTSALLESIENEVVLGACLDVLEFENDQLRLPLKENLPDVAHQLFASDRVVLSPHIAGLSAQSYEKLSKFLAKKILAALANL